MSTAKQAASVIQTSVQPAASRSLHHVLLAMEHAQVQRQHRQHEQVEDQPEDPVGGHGVAEAIVAGSN